MYVYIYMLYVHSYSYIPMISPSPHGLPKDNPWFLPSCQVVRLAQSDILTKLGLSTSTAVVPWKVRPPNKRWKMSSVFEKSRVYIEFRIDIPIGSMVLPYMVTFTINIPPMLAYIPAPWILWDRIDMDLPGFIMITTGFYISQFSSGRLWPIYKEPPKVGSRWKSDAPTFTWKSRLVNRWISSKSGNKKDPCQCLANTLW